MIGSPEDPIAVVKTGPFLDLVAVDTGSSPRKGDDVEVTLVILHLDDAVLVLESDLAENIKIQDFVSILGFTMILYRFNSE